MTAVYLVRARLLTLAPVTALVSTRIRALIYAQSETFPAIRIQQISQGEDFHLRGPLDLAVTRVQVDLSAYSKAAADALEVAVDGNGLGSNATGLRGWHGYIGSPGVKVDAIFPAGRNESYHPDELKLFRVSLDYMVHWRRS